MVVNPDNTTHEIRLIPRVSVLSTLSMVLVNEFTNIETTVAVTNLYDKGYLYLTFDFDFTERDNFSFTVFSDAMVIYRGNIFATTQNPQDFKLTEGVYL